MTEPTAHGSLQLTALTGIPAVEENDDLAALLSEAAAREGLELREGVLVVCQKVVSKAEGRIVRLAEGRVETVNQAA